MMIFVIASAFAGIAAGVFSGLIPGLHPNTIVVLVSASLLSGGFFPSDACAIAFLVSMGISNSIVFFIPSVFLGAPEEGSALSVLPGHVLLEKGLGYHAVRLTVIGGIGSVILLTLAMPLLVVSLPVAYSATRPFLHIILSLVAACMILVERRKIPALLCFTLAGLVGIFGSLLPINQSFYLFPVLSGLFGVSMLAVSIRKKSSIPEQTQKHVPVSRKTVAGSVVKGSFAGLFVGLLPGIGSSQAAVIANMMSRRKGREDHEGFLVSIGGVTTANALFALLSLWLIGNPRSGLSVAIGQIAEIGFAEFALMVSAALASCGIACIATLMIARAFSRHVSRINYRTVSMLVIALITFSVFALTSFYGLLLLATTTMLGIYANLSGIRRSHLMGVLLLPTILFFAGF